MTDKMAMRYLSPIKSLMKKLDFDRHYIEALDHAIKNLKERPQGEWKALTYHTCYCTNCHFDFDIMKCDFMTKMKFCPNCGADMRGENNE